MALRHTVLLVETRFFQNIEKVFQDLSYPTIFSKGNSSNLLLHTIYLHIRI